MAFVSAPVSGFPCLVTVSQVSCKSTFLGSLVARRPRCTYNPSVVRAVSSNDFKTGTTILMDGTIFRVQEFLHVKPGKGTLFQLCPGFCSFRSLRQYLLTNTMADTCHCFLHRLGFCPVKAEEHENWQHYGENFQSW